MPLEWEELVTQLDTHMPREAWAQTLVGIGVLILTALFVQWVCLLYTSPSPRD